MGLMNQAPTFVLLTPYCLLFTGVSIRIRIMKREKIPTEKIYLKDERFRISYYFTLEQMIHSLRKIGLINPPLVTTRDGHYVLVSGWKRVLASIELSLSTIAVTVNEDEDDLKIFLRAFYENLATRDLSLAEKAEIVHKLKRFGAKKEHIIKKYLPLLEIPAGAFHHDMLLAVAQFEPELKAAIHEKNIPFSSLQLLSEFKPEARKIVFPLLMPLSQNKQKEILEDLQEISLRENISAVEILNSDEIRNILVSKKISLVQKADRIRALLRRKRFPNLSSWEESFDSSLKKMRWPKEIGVKHTPFFEDANISVTFNFKNKQEFEGNLSMLKDMASKKEFSQLFR
jgi:ParB family chromosome partitioning protein